MGSQSLASTIERFFTLGRYDTIGILLFLLWILSPFGSQMTLRLLDLRDSFTMSTSGVQYFNTSLYSDTDPSGPSTGSSFESASGMNTDAALLTALVGASVLSTRAIATSPIDTWNNVKIPLFDDALLPSVEGQNNEWIDADRNINHTWVSLSGIMIQGLPESGSSNVVLEFSYLNVLCLDSKNVSQANEKQELDSLGIQLSNTINSLRKTAARGQEWTNIFLGLNSHSTGYPDPHGLVFGSTNVDNFNFTDIFKCTLSTTRLEVNVSCEGSTCQAGQVRRSVQDYRPSSDMMIANVTLEILLEFVPSALGFSHPGISTPMDNYLFGSKSPFSFGHENDKPNGYANTPGSDIARRLTTVLNTVYQASLCPYGIVLGSTVNFTACQLELAPPPVANGTATTRSKHPLSIYEAKRWHAIALLVISAILQLAAFATVGLALITRAPDILGFVSSITRDNPFLADVVPEGGSALNGIERARALGNVRVRLADIKPENSVGKIAFIGDCGVNGTPAGRLGGGGRLYD